MTASESTFAGQRVGRYRLLAPLGEGGMAKVFIALKDDAHEICVLKQLHLQLEEQEEAVIRFTREAHIASLLRHESIAGISDAGVEDDKFCIAMDFIAGETIEAMVRAAARAGGVIPIEVTIPIILAALDGLDYAHELKSGDGQPLSLVHRDLSPRNIMLTYAGQVKLIDFGIAKGNVDEYKTAVGALMGTPYYMSPEQARAVAVDRRSDLYTLAVVLFEMLAGRRLVHAKGRAKILMTVAREPAPPIRTINPDVPASIESVLAKALQKKPDHRYPTARAFRAALADASGALAKTPRPRLSKFINSVFPEGQARANEYRALANTQPAGPAVDPTRVAMPGEDPVIPSALTSPTAADRTRTGYLDTEAPEVGLPTRTGPPLAATPSTPAIQPLSSADPMTAVPFQTHTVGDAQDPFSASRSHLTGTRQTSAVQKLGVGLTLLLLCIVGYVAYGQLVQPVVLPDRVVAPVEPPTTPAIEARAAPRVAAQTPKVPNDAPPPPAPPPTRRPRRTTPVAAVIEKKLPDPPPAPPPPARAKSSLRRDFEAISKRSDATSLSNRIQNLLDNMPDSKKKDRAQAALDRMGTSVKIGAMKANLDDALDAIGK